VLDSAIDSNLPGPIYAHLAGPVYSPKGVLLMEAGTQVVGKYESMKQNGVNRLEAVSTAAYTPNGIVVPLAGDSLGDDLGRTGLSATIDKRLIERFGGAVLLDLSQAGLSIVQANVAKGGNTYLSFNGSDQLANQILQSTINLPPIGTKNQGSTIAILMTAPIDFSDSYRVVAK
jgi:type IV secretion system protein VirB10